MYGSRKVGWKRRGENCKQKKASYVDTFIVS
jgi:hypothetical protein